MAVDDRLAADLRTYTQEVTDALGTRLVALVLYGSAVDGDWVRGMSDVNTAIVVPAVTLEVLDALAPIVVRRRDDGFAVPLIVDPEYLARAADVFPMELDDIRARHRLLAGRDPFAPAPGDREALRRECELEARSKLLRLRALYLVHAHGDGELGRLLAHSVTSFLVLLRHLLRLRGVDVVPGQATVLAAGERLLGPLPGMRAAVALRRDPGAIPASSLRASFAGYLAEVERLVASVDALGA